MAKIKGKRSWAATLWGIVALVFAGTFAVNYWVQGDAIPSYSFLYGFLSGGAGVTAWGAKRRARKA